MVEHGCEPKTPANSGASLKTVRLPCCANCAGVTLPVVRMLSRGEKRGRFPLLLLEISEELVFGADVVVKVPL